MFDNVGVTAGRGMGCRVACPRPLLWRYPSGFAGVCFAIVLGLGVRWSVRGLLVDALWPLLVSMGRAFRVFDDVVRSLAEVLVVLLVVIGVDGADYLHVRACSRVWACLLAVVWVVWLLVGGRLLRVHGCGRAYWQSSGSSRSSGLPAG